MKSPVRNTGTPLAARPGKTSSWRWIAGSRVERSRASTAERGSPSRTQYGPYGSEGLVDLRESLLTQVLLRPDQYDQWLQGSPEEAFQLVRTCHDELKVDRTPELWSKSKKAPAQDQLI